MSWQRTALSSGMTMPHRSRKLSVRQRQIAGSAILTLLQSKRSSCSKPSLPPIRTTISYSTKMSSKSLSPYLLKMVQSVATMRILALAQSLGNSCWQTALIVATMVSVCKTGRSCVTPLPRKRRNSNQAQVSELISTCFFLSNQHK